MTTDLLEKRKIVALAGQIIKADTGPKGQLTAVVNTGYLDRQGDVMAVGCWSKVCQERQSPLLFWQHDYKALPLGSASHLQELRPGDPRIPSLGGKSSGNVGALLARLNFSLGTQAGRDAFTLASEGHIKEFSVAVTNRKEDESTSYEGVRTVKLVDEIIELSMVLKGASLGTYTLESKAAFNRLQFAQSVTNSKLIQQIADCAEDLTILKLWAYERQEAAEADRREAVAAGLAVAAESVRQSLKRAAEVREIERMANLTGNYWQARPARPLTAEEERVKKIRAMAGHHV